MDNQTGRVLGMLDDVRGTQGQSRGERWKMLQRQSVTIFKLRKFLQHCCTACILCRAICNLPSIAFFLRFSQNVLKLISDCRASNTEILSGTLKYQIMSEEKLGVWKLQDSNEVVSDNLKRK